MENIYDIIKSPIITEKSSKLVEDKNTYTFKVAKTANKIQIKKAVEEIFKVKVVNVNTVNVLPRRKRVGRYEGLKSGYKKAIVTLAQGDKIASFQI